MKQFTVRFHTSDSEYLTALRLVTGAVASLGGADVDSAEDFKVCVTESVLLLKNGGFESVVCEFSCADGVICTVTGEGGCRDLVEDSEFSLALISALVQSCEIDRRGGQISKVLLKL